MIDEQLEKACDEWFRKAWFTWLNDSTHIVNEPSILMAFKAGYKKAVQDSAQIRNEALEEAARIPRQYAMALTDGPFGSLYPEDATVICNASTNMADQILALKYNPEKSVDKEEKA